MRPRLIMISALAAALAVTGTVAVAASSAPEAAGPPPPGIELPARPPAQDGRHAEAFSYLSSDRLARAAGYRPAAKQPAASSGAAASVTVSAFVLPTRTIVIDADNTVTSIISNTEKTGARDAMYVVHRGTSSGPIVPITDELWPAIRAAFAAADHGTGEIYSAS